MLTVASVPTWRYVRIVFFTFVAVWSLVALFTLKGLGSRRERVAIKVAIDVTAHSFGRMDEDNELAQLPDRYRFNSPPLQHNFPYLIEPDFKDSCSLVPNSSDPDGPKDADKYGKYTSKAPLPLLVMVHSRASHFEHRQVIRKTWAAAEKRFYKVAFLLGNPRDEITQQKLLDESRQHGDLLQEDFYETYRNITLKALMGLKWADQYCPRAAYVVKCDDDMFFAVRRLINHIAHHVLPRQRLLLCHPNKHASVMRDGKYAVSKELYPYRKWPEFCFGGCWIASRDVIHDLHLASRTTPQIYLDDVYVTGILRLKSHIKITRTAQGSKLFCHARGSPERVIELWQQAIHKRNWDADKKVFECFS